MRLLNAVRALALDVEFLDAHRAFNDTTQSYNEARAGYARSVHLIDAAVGNGL